MKKLKPAIILFIALFIAFSINFAPVEAKSKTVDLKNYRLSKTSITKFAKKAKCKKKKSKRYKTYFGVGKKVTVGYNQRYEDTDSGKGIYYLLVRNKGNKNVRIWGIRPGMKRSACRKKYRPYTTIVQYWPDDGNPNIDVVPFGFECGGTVRFKYKKGKLVSWEMRVRYNDANWW